MVKEDNRSNREILLDVIRKGCDYSLKRNNVQNGDLSFSAHPNVGAENWRLVDEMTALGDGRDLEGDEERVFLLKQEKIYDQLIELMDSVLNEN
jgi:hypothetical protein